LILLKGNLSWRRTKVMNSFSAAPLILQKPLRMLSFLSGFLIRGDTMEKGSSCYRKIK